MRGLSTPDENSHSNNILGKMAGFSQTIDTDVGNKIKQLVGEGVSNVRKMRRHFLSKMYFFVERKFPLYNRAFRRPTKDIRKHMYKEDVKLTFSKLDQVNIEQMAKEWKKNFPDDNFFFRRFGNKVNNGEFEEGNSNDDGDIERDVP